MDVDSSTGANFTCLLHTSACSQLDVVSDLRVRGMGASTYSCGEEGELVSIGVPLPMQQRGIGSAWSKLLSRAGAAVLGSSDDIPLGSAWIDVRLSIWENQVDEGDADSQIVFPVGGSTAGIVVTLHADSVPSVGITACNSTGVLIESSGALTLRYRGIDAACIDGSNNA